uniref:UNC93-like protein n=1 Tax=Timema cristinae TaxID=61476 RepID=A0A7R9H6Q8_TIMCR|nr:unnamed protein product [Timema cristinae]
MAMSDVHREKWRILRNVSVLGLAFMVQFSAYTGITHLQSTVNSSGGLGTASLTSVYAGLIFSSVFLSTSVIRWLGCKWTVIAAFIAYMPYIGAQFYPQFSTMIPTGLLMGLGGGPLWCAKCTYVTVITKTFSEITSVDIEVITVQFFAIFFTIYIFCHVWGNLVSSLDMLHDVSPVAIYCNIRHCEVGNYRVYLQAYVSCAWGIRNIGYVMICYGVTNALSAVITGSLVRLTGRVPLVVCATVLHSGVVVGLLCWEPRSHDKAMFFVMSGLWGVADGVWQIQINAMYGVLFPGQEEAAFSNFKLCTSIGYILTYSYSSYICTDVKLYIISTLMLVGVAGYLLVEWKERNRTDTRLNKE